MTENKKNILKQNVGHSSLGDGDEYFQFEQDFVEDNIRCIPMIVRFKMDAAGIKLKLSEWSKFTPDERAKLASMPCQPEENTKIYYDYLEGLVKKHTGDTAVKIEVEKYPSWANAFAIPEPLQLRAKEIDKEIDISQWIELTHLQRFALLKLCRPGHESKNFKKAMKEFRIIE